VATSLHFFNTALERSRRNADFTGYRIAGVNRASNWLSPIYLSVDPIHLYALALTNFRLEQTGIAVRQKASPPTISPSVRHLLAQRPEADRVQVLTFETMSLAV
jgi:hypothetical protein